MNDFIASTAFLFMLLNPFLVVVYLVDVIQKLDLRKFSLVLFRGGLIAALIFCLFAVVGDAIFSKLMRAEFASFQIFGGIIFILIGVQFVFKGPNAIELLRGDSENVAGAIAMPVLVGPGTISASVLAGENLSPLVACLAVFIAVAACIGSIILLKMLHDFTVQRRRALVDRYIEIAGRITALFIGTIAVQMVMQGIMTWVHRYL